MRSGPACAPTLLLFPLEEVVLEEAAGSQLLAVVTSGAVRLGHGAELLVAAEDCCSWPGDGRRHPRLPLRSASPGTVQGPPGWPCSPRCVLAAAVPPPPCSAMPSWPHCSCEGRGLGDVKRRKSFSIGKEWLLVLVLFMVKLVHCLL